MSRPDLGDRVEGLPAGVEVRRSSLGGYGVWWKNRHIGWIHESGDRWNAYLKPAKTGDPGTPVGRYPLVDAVREIAIASGWPT
ncbi:MAG: hypothetical protein SYR96_18465 [Actinomycetota bacterium]|nr:hypothetical protein [Actinomycetota bacterium]